MKVVFYCVKKSGSISPAALCFICLSAYDLVVKALHFRIADVTECPVSYNTIQLIPDCPCPGILQKICNVLL